MSETRDDNTPREEVKHEGGKRYERVGRPTAGIRQNTEGQPPRQRQRIIRPRISSTNNEGYTPRPPYQQRQYQEGENAAPRPAWQQGERQHYTPRRQNDDGQGGYRPPRRPQNGGYHPQGAPYRPQNGGYRQQGEGGYNPQQGYPQQGNGPRRPRQQGFNNNNRYNFKRRIEYKETHLDPNEPIRLNKFLANAGACSRREADAFIQAGVVSVNGKIVTELGTKVLRTDNVMFHDQPVKMEKKVYVLLNKPKDYVTTVDDPQNRKTVMDLVKDACPERIYPVGRLDRNTTGVLLLTNDGELATKLTHPHYVKKKVYHVFLDKNISFADMQKISDGVALDDGVVHVDAVDYASPTDKKQVGIELHSGKNRIVRRLFEALGYYVTKLDRVQFCGLTKKNVRRGDWRFLTEREVDMLRMGAFE